MLLRPKLSSLAKDIETETMSIHNYCKHQLSIVSRDFIFLCTFLSVLTN